MTEHQLYALSVLALVLSIVTAFLTRATPRRIVGAIAGAGAVGVVLLGLIALGERIRVWHFEIEWRPYILALFVINIALCAYALLITWRIARRFGRRGLLVLGFVAAVLGPPRDYWWMSKFPEWGYYAPGFSPVIAISAAYVIGLIVGHGVMRLVAGPSRGDVLARRAWVRVKDS